MKNARIIWVMVVLVYTSVSAVASIEITTIDLSIDKPAYNARYSFGVDISVISDLSIDSIYVEHITTSFQELGAWYLDEISPGRWFEHTPAYAAYSKGPITGYVKLTVTAETGEQIVYETLDIPTDIELDFVSGLQLLDEQGYRLLMDPVDGAESYFWNISDVETRESVTSGYANHPADFPTIPYNALQFGRVYKIYGHARNSFSCGSYDLEAASLFRSYNYIQFEAVPEPMTISLLAFGSLVLRCKRTLRRH